MVKGLKKLFNEFIIDPNYIGFILFTQKWKN